MIIDLRVDNDMLSVLSPSAIVSGSKNYYSVRAIFSGEWTGLDKYLLVSIGGGEFYTLTLEQGSDGFGVILPESLVAEEGFLEFGILGKDGDTLRISTDRVRLKVLCGVSESETIPPMPNAGWEAYADSKVEEIAAELDEKYAPSGAVRFLGRLDAVPEEYSKGDMFIASYSGNYGGLKMFVGDCAVAICDMGEAFSENDWYVLRRAKETIASRAEYEQLFNDYTESLYGKIWLVSADFTLNNSVNTSLKCGDMVVRKGNPFLGTEITEDGEIPPAAWVGDWSSLDEETRTLLSSGGEYYRGEAYFDVVKNIGFKTEEELEAVQASVPELIKVYGSDELCFSGNNKHITAHILGGDVRLCVPDSVELEGEVGIYRLEIFKEGGEKTCLDLGYESIELKDNGYYNFVIGTDGTNWDIIKSESADYNVL